MIMTLVHLQQHRSHDHERGSPADGSRAPANPRRARELGRARKAADAPGTSSVPMTGYEEWSRAGWAAHLPGVADIPAQVAGLGEATIPGLAAAAAARG